MCFTDGKPRVATEEDLERKWVTFRRNFRCRLCGYKFKVGDYWRFVYANGLYSPSRYGNFLTCKECDGDDILARAAIQEAEALERFWWFMGE